MRSRRRTGARTAHPSPLRDAADDITFVDRGSRGMGTRDIGNAHPTTPHEPRRVQLQVGRGDAEDASRRLHMTKPSGRLTESLGRRGHELAIQLPERASVHGAARGTETGVQVSPPSLVTTSEEPLPEYGKAKPCFASEKVTLCQ